MKLTWISKLSATLVLSLMSVGASAAITNFDIKCTIYTALIPAKDPNKHWNYNIDDVFRLKVQNGKATMAYGYGPGTTRVGQPITWEPMFSDVTANVGIQGRWITNVNIPMADGKAITVVLKQGSRANEQGHFIDADFVFPEGFKLRDKTVIKAFNAGFCF